MCRFIVKKTTQPCYDSCSTLKEGEGATSELTQKITDFRYCQYVKPVSVSDAPMMNSKGNSLHCLKYTRTKAAIGVLLVTIR